MSEVAAAILGCEGLALTARERAFFAAAQPLGFILFARNVADPAQLFRLTAELRDAVGRDAPVLVDQEGGRVQRMRAPHWREWLPPLDQVARTADPESAARAMHLRYRLIAAELRTVGIDADCAPMADVARPETHPFLRNRCYGEDAETVISVARAVSEGLLAGGVVPVLKHIPGHGRAQLDSHLDLPVVSASADELRDVDFAPFRALADLPMGMTAHLVYEAFDPEHPATQSAAMIQLIREEIRFDGLLMTDDVSMQALKGSIGARCAASIAAGCDVVLHCNGELAEMEEAVAAAGPLSDLAILRANRALARRSAVPEIDIPAVEADLRDLLGGSVYG